MKKPIRRRGVLLLLTIVLTVTSTSQAKKNVSQVDSNADNHYKLNYTSPQLKSKLPKIRFVFEADFKLDTVKLYRNDSLLINKVIVTDNRIGLAFDTALVLHKKCNIFLKYNGYEKVKLENIADYSYVYVSNGLDKKTVTLTFSTQPRFYK